MILGEDKKRLSKRHGAISVLDYRDQGFLAETLFNFLSLLGWSPDDDSQILDRERLIGAFDLDGVGKAGAVFDTSKLEWMNGEYIRGLSTDELEPLVRPAFEAAIGPTVKKPRAIGVAGAGRVDNLLDRSRCLHVLGATFHDYGALV